MFLIDVPVAGILPATAGSVETFIYPEGGLLAGFVYGLKTNLNIGLFFGGTGIIGSGDVTWNNIPGLMVRYRAVEENAVRPAVVVGFDTQGHDGYVKSERRFVVKSPGFFVTASKNYVLLGSLCFHSGISYTLERSDNNMKPNVFMGFEKTLGPIVSFLGEYNFGFDDEMLSGPFWKGYLNLGFRFSTNIGINADVHFKNLLTTESYYSKIVRTVRIQYVRYF